MGKQGEGEGKGFGQLNFVENDRKCLCRGNFLDGQAA